MLICLFSYNIVSSSFPVGTKLLFTATSLLNNFSKRYYLYYYFLDNTILFSPFLSLSQRVHILWFFFSLMEYSVCLDRGRRKLRRSFIRCYDILSLTCERLLMQFREVFFSVYYMRRLFAWFFFIFPSSTRVIPHHETSSVNGASNEERYLVKKEIRSIELQWRTKVFDDRTKHHHRFIVFQTFIEISLFFSLCRSIRYFLWLPIQNIGICCCLFVFRVCLGVHLCFSVCVREWIYIYFVCYFHFKENERKKWTGICRSTLHRSGVSSTLKKWSFFVSRLLCSFNGVVKRAQFQKRINVCCNWRPL